MQRFPPVSKYKSVTFNSIILPSLSLSSTIKDYEESYPKDPSLQLVSIDGYIINKQFDKALKSIDVLDSSIHGDSFLNYLRGNVLFHNEKYEESLKMFAKVNEDFPDFFDAYESKLAIYLQKKNHLIPQL